MPWNVLERQSSNASADLSSRGRGDDDAGATTANLSMPTCQTHFSAQRFSIIARAIILGGVCPSQLCENVDRPSLAEARANVDTYGSAAGYDRSPEEVFVRSKYGAPRTQAFYGDDVKYWQRRVDKHCPPGDESGDYDSEPAGWGTVRWDAAPTETGMHDPERLPQILRSRGITPASDLLVSDSAFWALMGIIPLLCVVAYNYGAKKPKGRRARR